jgi:hypothetical protein
MGARDLARARRLYEQFAEACESAGWIAYIPHRRTDPVHAVDIGSGSVYAVDLVELQCADAIVAYLGEPSLGVGAELALSMQAGKRILAVHEESREVSRFISGMLSQYRHADVYGYATPKDAAAWICQRLSEVAFAFSEKTARA